MNRILCVVAVIALAACSLAQFPPVVAVAPAPPADVVKALDLLEARDTTLKDFTAGLVYVVDKVRTGDTEKRTGNVAYLKDGAATKFAIKLENLVIRGTGAKKINQDIVYDGRWLIFQDSLQNPKEFRKTELAPPGEDYNPLKLGNGPLPLPIGQKTADILRDFTVTIEPAADPTLPGSADMIHLRLIPFNPKRYEFKQADLWIDPKLELPIRARRVNLSDDIDTVTLTDPKVNTGAATIPALPTPAPGTGWNITVEPYKRPTTAPAPSTTP